MLDEIHAVSRFLALNLAPVSPKPVDLDRFHSSLSHHLRSHYLNHWYPLDPERGSCYRSLFRHGLATDDVDPLILQAARQAGIPSASIAHALLTTLGPFWTIWVDPGCVSIRIAAAHETKEIWGMLQPHVRRRLIMAQPTTTTHEADGAEMEADRYSLEAGRRPSVQYRPPSRTSSASPTKRSRAVRIVRPTTVEPAPVVESSVALQVEQQHPLVLGAPLVLSPELRQHIFAAENDARSTPLDVQLETEDDSNVDADATVIQALLPAASLREFESAIDNAGDISPTSDVFNRPSSRSSDASDRSTSDSYLSDSGLSMNTAAGQSDLRGHSPASSIGSSLMMSKSTSGSSPSPLSLGASSTSSDDGKTPSPPTLMPFVFPPKAIRDSLTPSTTPAPGDSPSKIARRADRPHGHTPNLSTCSNTSSVSISSTRSRGIVQEHSNGKVGVLGGGVLLGVPSPAASNAGSPATTPGGGVGASPRKRGDNRRRRTDSSSGGGSAQSSFSGSIGGSVFGSKGMNYGVLAASQNLLYAQQGLAFQGQQQQHYGGH